MTKKEAIAVFECLATEMTAILAGIPKSEAAADQIKRYIDAYDIAISALRIQQKQESECAKCSGIVYRQTDSGKIIPVDQRCGVKITPPCYVPDGDGCAYQIYGDNNDEPIARCKSCPLCQSDKIRHKQEPAHNDPLTLDELREAAKTGDPVPPDKLLKVHLTPSLASGGRRIHALHILLSESTIFQGLRTMSIQR